MEVLRRLRRRLRLLVERLPDLLGATVDAAPSALAGIATVAIAALGILLLGLTISAVATLLG